MTYLSGHGAPTVVIAQRVLAGPGRATAATGYVSHPAAGKHIAFDGDLLHGVPPELMLPRAADADGLRLKLLVNVWSEHRLRCADPLPDECVAAARLKVGHVEAFLRDAGPAAAAVARLGSVGCAGGVHGFAFGRSGDEEHELWMPLPAPRSMEPGGTVRLDFSGGPGCVTVRKPPRAGGKRKRKKKGKQSKRGSAKAKQRKRDK